MNSLFSISGLKNNIINTNSTGKNHPTKRLDMVDSATGRINNTITNLEIKHNITTSKVKERIGHLEHKSRLFTKIGA